VEDVMIELLTPALREDRLYASEGGRVFCGKVLCSWAEAEADEIEEEELLAHPLSCGVCGWRPLVATDGAVMPWGGKA
jgi:hypothetical protein